MSRSSSNPAVLGRTVVALPLLLSSARRSTSFSSTVSCIARTLTVTGRVWPVRCARLGWGAIVSARARAGAPGPRITYLDSLNFDIIRQRGLTEDDSGRRKQVSAWEYITRNLSGVFYEINFWGKFLTYSPRAPYFSSITRTRYRDMELKWFRFRRRSSTSQEEVYSKKAMFAT